MIEPSYKIKLVKDEDAEAVMDLLRRTFFLDEPMNQSVDLCADGKCEELEQFCVDALHAGMSFKAVDKQGNVVGAMLNGVIVLKRDDNNNSMDMAQKCANPKFQKILYVLAKCENDINLCEKFPHEKQAVDVKVVATDPNWRRRGIMNELLKETEKMTMERGIRLIRINTSSTYSAKSAEKLGFTCTQQLTQISKLMENLSYYQNHHI